MWKFLFIFCITFSVSSNPTNSDWKQLNTNIRGLYSKKKSMSGSKDIDYILNKIRLNNKLTTPEDFQILNNLLKEHGIVVFKNIPQESINEIIKNDKPLAKTYYSINMDKVQKKQPGGYQVEKDDSKTTNISKPKDETKITHNGEPNEVAKYIFHGLRYSDELEWKCSSWSCVHNIASVISIIGAIYYTSNYYNYDQKVNNSKRRNIMVPFVPEYKDYIHYIYFEEYIRVNNKKKNIEHLAPNSIGAAFSFAFYFGSLYFTDNYIVKNMKNNPVKSVSVKIDLDTTRYYTESRITIDYSFNF